jgi:predicted alpha/beta hydrolase
VQDGMHAWATLDMVALHSFIENRFPESDLHIIGHSGGAWLLGFIPPPKNLKGLIFICMPNGYYNSFFFPNNIRLYLTWKFWIPRIVKKNGILGNSKFYSGAPLPGKIALDWAASGLKKKFIEDDSFQPNGKFIKDYIVPTLAFTFSDDEVCDSKSTFSMLEKFSNLKKTHRHIHPKEINEAEIGHYGFLKPSQKKKLWPEILQWINQT